ncbi:MAG: Dihydrofolate reductase [uncultured Thermomicrobiales bacterium]|uniref:Dihydrofolate reductase n=1 Tax=uncultured Thermomicrobiales bacterium TaxID=1645740 RepID=A0A6J4V9G5_9BACT|nr:MAG: Dihydrofolate reductase [uncultured Thermomicrobiales bacterium]
MMGFSISLDGCIASTEREDAGLHDWLFAGGTPVEVAGTRFMADSAQSVRVFEEVVGALGAVIVGRTAFGEGDEPFFDLPTFVLTTREPPPRSSDKVTYVSGGIERALELATAAAGAKQVNVFGGASTARQYLAAGLVDELRLTVVPILLGDGLRLFGPDPARRTAEIVGVVPAPTVTHLHLRLK